MPEKPDTRREKLREKAEFLMKDVKSRKEEVDSELGRWNMVKGELSAVGSALDAILEKLDRGGDMISLGDEIEVVEETLKRKRTDDLEELRERLKYMQAEVENVRKTSQREREETVRFANEGLILKLLEVVDSLEIALNSSKGSAGVGIDPKGVAMILRQLSGVLESEGLAQIKTVGEKFDPYRHEAVEQAQSDQPDGTVLEELNKGYTFRKKVIRPARVKVAKKGD